MDANQKAEIAEAMTALIESSDAETLYKQLMGVFEVARKGVPVRLTGRPAVVNPLLDLLLQDHPAGERVLQLTNKYRAEKELGPLEGGGFKRKPYMRDLMATKRDRQRRLVELVNELRSEHDKIKGSVRIAFEQMHANRWFAVRTEREEAMRKALGRGLSVDKRMDVIAGLWADVTKELDDLEEFVRAEIRKPLSQRAPNGFNFKLQPKKGKT